MDELLSQNGFECTRIERGGVSNLFARWGGGNNGRTFGFNGHTDVVPVGDIINALGRGQDRESLGQFLTVISQTMGPEAIGQFINPDEVIKRLAAASGIDVLNLVKSMEELQGEQQQQMQQQEAMMMQQQAPQLAAVEQKREQAAMQMMQQEQAPPPPPQ